MEQRRATLDSAGIRSRLRREPYIAYTPRQTPNPRLRLISEFKPVAVNRPKPFSDKPKIPTNSRLNLSQPTEPPAKIGTTFSKQTLPDGISVTEAELASLRIESAPKSKQDKNPRRSTIKKVPGIHTIVAAIAILLIGFGGYMTLSSWKTDKIVKTEADALTQQANQVANSANQTQPTVTASTTRPTAAAVANYLVAPALPRYLIIPELGVDARVLSVGVNASGALGTPNNIYDTAWYDESATPGQQGAVLIDGHVAGYNSPGVFGTLQYLQPGDNIQVERGDGTIFNYQVVKTETYPATGVDMKAAMTPIDPGKPGLNLITCTGSIIPDKAQYNERLIIFATQV